MMPVGKWRGMGWKAGASVAALLWLFAPARAADADVSTAEEIPEYVPSEPAKGWYLRGDVTYLVNDPVYDFTLLGEETRAVRFGGGVGVGYRFNDWFRADLTVAYAGGERYDYDDGTVSLSARHDMWSGLVSGYADLGTFAGFTPYAGIGVGVLHSRDDFATNIAALDFEDSQTEFAYALDAGIGYRMTDRLTLDVGYRFLASPQMQYLDTGTLTLDRGLKQHQVKVGLRYDLW